MEGSAGAALRGILKRLLGFAMQQDKQQQGSGRSRTNRQDGRRRGGSERKKTKQNKGGIEFFIEGNREEIPFKKQLGCYFRMSECGGDGVYRFHPRRESLRCDLHCVPRHLILICCLSLSIYNSSFDHRLTPAFETDCCLVYGCLNWLKSLCLKSQCVFVFTSLALYSDTDKYNLHKN